MGKMIAKDAFYFGGDLRRPGDEFEVPLAADRTSLEDRGLAAPAETKADTAPSPETKADADKPAETKGRAKP